MSKIEFYDDEVKVYEKDISHNEKIEDINENEQIEEILKEAGVSDIKIENENVKIGVDKDIDDVLSYSGIDVKELENDDEKYDYQYTGTGKICKIKTNENTSNNIDMSFEIVGENTVTPEEWKEIKEIADKHHEEDLEFNKKINEQILSEQKNLEACYNDIKNKVYIGYKTYSGVKNKIIKCYKEFQPLEGYRYYLDLVDDKNNYHYMQLKNYFLYGLIKHLPLTWYIKYYWNKYNPISLYKKYKSKDDFIDDINTILYNGGCMNAPLPKNIIKSIKKDDEYKNIDGEELLSIKKELNDMIKNHIPFEERDNYLYHKYCKILQQIKDKKYVAIEDCNRNNEISKILYSIVNNSNRFYNILVVEDIDGIIRENYLNEEDIFKLKTKIPFSWYIKKFFWKFLPKTSKNKLDKEIEEILDLSNNECTYKSKPIKPSFSDKVKWVGHNLFHCKCSDNIEESCEIDIENIIKNNTMKQIKKDKEELLKNPNWDNDNLILYK